MIEYVECLNPEIEAESFRQPHLLCERGVDLKDSGGTQDVPSQITPGAGGWNRDKSGDPYDFSPRMIERALKIKPPVTVDQLVYYMNGKPLDFEPGTQEHYSNYGFMLAGRVVGQVAGRPYIEATNRVTFAPMGIRQIEMAVTRHDGADSFYLPNEAKRYFLGEP